MKFLSREYVTEGVLIVASILVAFSIDAWWAERQERQQEALILTALRDEFQLNADRLPRFIDNHRKTMSAATAVLQRMRSATDGQRVVIKYADLFNALDHGSFDALNGTMNAVLQSGDLSLIENAEIRARIAGWPAILLDATENEVLLRNVWGPRLSDVLGRDVDLSPMEPDWGCDVNGDSLCANGEVEIAVNTEVSGLLMFAYGWAKEAARELEYLQTETNDIVSLIDEELGYD